MSTANDTANTAGTNEIRFIRLPEVMTRVGLSRPMIYKSIAAGKFPRHIKIGAATVWNSQEIGTWIRERIASSRNGRAE